MNAELERRKAAIRGMWGKATFDNALVAQFDNMLPIGPLTGLGVWSMTWDQIETSLGVYDWSFIDSTITKIQQAGKYVGLGLSGGVWMPSFMYTEHSLSSFTFTYDNPNEPTWDGLEFTSPYFWETDYLDVWLAFIAVAANRYKDNLAITDITVGGPQNLFHEFFMPVWFEPICAAEGWTAQKHVDAWAYAIAGYSNLFPEHLLKLRLAPLSGDNTWAEALVDDALAVTEEGQSIIMTGSVNDGALPPAGAFGDYHQLMNDSGMIVGGEVGEIFMTDGPAWQVPISSQDPDAYAATIDYMRTLRGTFMHGHENRILNPLNYNAFDRLKPAGYLPSRPPRASRTAEMRIGKTRQRYMGT